MRVVKETAMKKRVRIFSPSFLPVVGRPSTRRMSGRMCKAGVGMCMGGFGVGLCGIVVCEAFPSCIVMIK